MHKAREIIRLYETVLWVFSPLGWALVLICTAGWAAGSCEIPTTSGLKSNWEATEAFRPARTSANVFVRLRAEIDKRGGRKNERV